MSLASTENQWFEGCLFWNPNRLEISSDQTSPEDLPARAKTVQSERVDRVDPVGLQHHLHLLERGFVNLGDAAFVDAEDSADFLHGHLVVVQEDYFLVTFREGFHRNTEDGPHLLVGAHVIGLSFGLTRPFESYAPPVTVRGSSIVKTLAARAVLCGTPIVNIIAIEPDQREPSSKHSQ